MELQIATGDGCAYTLWPECCVPDAVLDEDRAYTLRLADIPDDIDRAGCHLRMGGVDQGVGRLEGDGALSWSWFANEYVGRVQIAIERRGEPLIAPTEIVVSPSHHKLTQAQFAAMVEDITQEALIAFSLSPATRNVALQQRWERLGLSQLEYLNQRLLSLKRAIEAIARRPLRRLDEEEMTVALASAPVVDARSVIKLVQRLEDAPRPQAAHLPAGTRRLQASLRGALPADVATRRRSVSYDVYENRLVKHFLERLYRVLRRTRRELATAATDGNLDPEIQNLARRRAAELGQHQKILYTLRALDFLSDVEALRTFKPVTQALRKDPLYARFYTLYRQFERAVSPFDGDPFQLSLEKTWQLYEYWCFFQVIAALRQVCKRSLAFDAQDMLRIHRDRVSLAMPQASVKINAQVSVHFQKSYSYYGWSALYEPSRVGTYSHEMRPDISIEVRDSLGKLVEIVVLDPKYRVAASSINEALSDLHCYKDAIVDYDRTRLVRLALILCPSSDQTRQVYFEPAYIELHGLGAAVLAPGMGDAGARLVDVLERRLGQYIT